MFRRGGVFAALGLLVALAALLSLAWGQMEIPFSHVLASLAQGMDLPFFSDVAVPPDEDAVLWQIRLPRTVVGLMVGAGLGLSGAVLQGIFANPLADPGIIGVSSGASVGAILAIATGLAAASFYALPLCALLGALLAVGLTVSLAMRHGRVPVLTLLLSGVVVGMFLAAVTAAILTALNENKMQAYLFWTIGGLDYRRWDHVFLAALPMGVSAVIMLALARHLDVLALGDAEARMIYLRDKRAVGMPVTRYRMLFLALASLTTATGVCVSGNIGFVGLVVPHMMRLLLGPGHRWLLPASLLAGGAFLVLCDALGRIIVPATEIRVGIMTAFIGTPYFLYLLRRETRKMD